MHGRQLGPDSAGRQPGASGFSSLINRKCLRFFETSVRPPCKAEAAIRPSKARRPSDFARRLSSSQARIVTELVDVACAVGNAVAILARMVIAFAPGVLFAVAIRKIPG
jgi:hypothetical protein